MSNVSRELELDLSSYPGGFGWGLWQEQGRKSIIVFSHKLNENLFSSGNWVAQFIKHVPSAQVLISGSWDRTIYRAPCSTGSLYLPLLLLILTPSHSLK